MFSDLLHDVICLNCGRLVAVLTTDSGGLSHLKPPAQHTQPECELRDGRLRCIRCGGRAFVEGLSVSRGVSLALTA